MTLNNPENKAVVLVDKEELDRFRHLACEVCIEAGSLDALAILCDCDWSDTNIEKREFPTVLTGLSQILRDKVRRFNTLSSDLCEVYDGLEEVAECPE